MILSEDQQMALTKMEDFILSKENVLVLSGAAGSGKTHILKEYILYLDSLDYQFILCAPTHRAKLVLEQATGYDSITIHKLLALAPNIEVYNLDYKDLKFYSAGFDILPRNGIVIIDEASMINDHIYKLLDEYSTKQNCKILYISDFKQLAPINESLSKVASCKNKISLTKIHRQAEDNPIMPVLTKLRSTSIKHFENIENAINVYNDAKSFILASIPYFKNAILTQNINDVKILAYRNMRVQEYNKVIRKALFREESKNQYNKGEILTGYENFKYNEVQYYNSMDYIITDVSPLINKQIPGVFVLPGYNVEIYDPFYDKKSVVFILSKDISEDVLYSIGSIIENVRIKALQNKQIGNTRAASKYWRQYFMIMNSFATPFNIVYDNRVIKSKTFDYGYAISTHKSQGSSINNVFVDISDINSCRDTNVIRQLQYVALSRTRNKVFLLQY